MTATGILPGPAQILPSTAEPTGTILLTGDERITAAPALRCEIRIVK